MTSLKRVQTSDAIVRENLLAHGFDPDTYGNLGNPSLTSKGTRKLTLGIPSAWFLPKAAEAVTIPSDQEVEPWVPAERVLPASDAWRRKGSAIYGKQIIVQATFFGCSLTGYAAFRFWSIGRWRTGKLREPRAHFYCGGPQHSDMHLISFNEPPGLSSIIMICFERLEEDKRSLDFSSVIFPWTSLLHLHHGGNPKTT